MWRFQCYCIFIFLLGFHKTFARKNLAAPLNFWNSDRDKIEEYRKNGRTCGPCKFPFEHKNQTHYACFKDTDEAFYCRNQNGDYVGCPEDCPEGTVVFYRIEAAKGANNTLVLECHVWGSPNPIGYWKRNGMVMTVVHPEEPYLVLLKYNITLRQTEDDYGRYTCVAENYFSSADSALRFGRFDYQGQTFPRAPTNLRVDIKDTHATVSWDYEEENDFDGFKLYLTPGYIEETRSYPHLLKKQLEMRHLDPGTKYTVKVEAKNRVGTGDLSEPFEFTIPSDAKINRPINVTVKEIYYDRVDLEWVYDGDATEDRHIMFGTLVEPAQKWRDGKESLDISFSQNSDTISDLEPYTNYKLTVFSQPNLARRYAEPVYVRTLPQKPYPRYFNVDESDDFMVKINCTATGVPKPEITWEKVRDDLPSEYQDNVRVTYNEVGSVSSVLTMPRIESNYATYKCIAKNIAGNGTNWKFLNFKKPEDKYIADSMEDFVNNIRSIITGLRGQVLELREENMNLMETLNKTIEELTTTTTTEAGNDTEGTTEE